MTMRERDEGQQYQHQHQHHHEEKKPISSAAGYIQTMPTNGTGKINSGYSHKG